MNAIAERKTHFSTFLLGLLLLLFGVLLLISRAGVLDLDFTRIAAFAVLLVGGFEAITAFATSSQRRLFWGSVLFLSAMLVLLISYDFVPSSWNQIWPSALIIPGLAFLMLFFSHPKELSLLFISVLFMIAGVAGLFAERNDIGVNEGIFDSLRIIIPVAVVAAGVYIIWRNFLKARS